MSGKPLLEGAVSATPAGNIRDGSGRTFLWIEKAYAHHGPYVAACINHADGLAEALDDALDLIEGWLKLGRVELNPYGLENLAKRRRLIDAFEKEKP